MCVLCVLSLRSTQVLCLLSFRSSVFRLQCFSVCLHESALGGLYLGGAPCCCLPGGREGRRWRRCLACWSKGEFGVHWGGDRGRRWSLSEGQAHLLGAMRRRQGSKAGVGTSIRGDGQGQRAGSGRLLGQAVQEGKGQAAVAETWRVENLLHHRSHAPAAAALPRVGTPRRNPSCFVQVRPIRAAVVGALDEGCRGDASQPAT